MLVKHIFQIGENILTTVASSQGFPIGEKVIFLSYSAHQTIHRKSTLEDLIALTHNLQCAKTGFVNLIKCR